MKDTVFEYRVGEYHLRITFLEENVLYWEYIAAPNGQTGKNATEQIDRTQIRHDMLLMRWKEADGTQIIDVLDLGQMMMHANFVDAAGARSSSQAKLTLIKGNLSNAASTQFTKTTGILLCIMLLSLFTTQ